MKILSSLAIVAVAVAIPGAAFAGTYEYVNTNGSLETTTANSAAQALSASDISASSGVLLIPGGSMMSSSGSMTTSSGSMMSSSSTMMMGSSNPTTMSKADDLDATMHDLLTEHVAASLDVLRDINDGNKTAEVGALQEQDANAVDLAAAIGSVYGTSAQAAFLTDFRAHIVASNAYTQGIKDGSMTDQTTALANLDTQLQAISTLLSGANPNIDDATLLAALRQHEILINDSSVAYSKGDYTGAYTYERQAITQIGGGADYLADAIAKQYPAQFPGTPTDAASKLRNTLHDLLTEHVAASLDVLRDISDGNTAAETGALQEQDANAVDLAAAIGSVYGTSAQAAFLTDFRAHITASNAYTTALKNGSMTNETAALANLDTQLQAISTLLSGANPNIDDATLLAALRAHEVLVNNSSTAFNAGNVTSAYTIERQALTQIAGGADYLANAIVMQYPNKF